MNRTPTHDIDQIWDRRQKTALWHDLWIAHLQVLNKTGPNPGRYDKDIRAYEAVAAQFWGAWDVYEHMLHDADVAEARTHHELTAALEVFNERAEADTAHTGLTSCDITELATQVQIRRSLEVITGHARVVAEQLWLDAHNYQTTRIVGRTHGRPAQYTTLGLRYLTILEPLLAWLQHADQVLEFYRARPAAGAVGTRVDLWRSLGQPTGPVATGNASGPLSGVGPTTDTVTAEELARGSLWLRCMGTTETGRCALPNMHWAYGQPDHLPPRVLDKERSGEYDTGYRVADDTPPSWAMVYDSEIAVPLGFTSGGLVSRQTYHRGQDIRIAALLAELASIANTWAIDRRLEAMLGLGKERFRSGQIGSSAMPHKNNPRLSERICSLAAVTRSHLGAVAELASAEWLEGDVAGSAGRREILPAMFATADAILANWLVVARGWTPNLGGIRHDIETNGWECTTAAVMAALIEGGVPRPRAHEMVCTAAVAAQSEGGSKAFRWHLHQEPDCPFGEGELEELMMAESIGSVAHPNRAAFDVVGAAVAALAPTIDWEPAGIL